jgi:hypothetical protein
MSDQCRCLSLATDEGRRSRALADLRPAATRFRTPLPSALPARAVVAACPAGLLNRGGRPTETTSPFFPSTNHTLSTHPPSTPTSLSSTMSGRGKGGKGLGKGGAKRHRKVRLIVLIVVTFVGSSGLTTLTLLPADPA